MIATDMHKVTITIFTDPMMGLSYECEPVFRRLETYFGEQIELCNCMSLLVRDVRDFMLPSELKLDPVEGIAVYNRRLAKIYEEEESISGMPINMEGFHLFDEAHTTSLPLNLAYKAAELTDPDKAGQFLYRLRYATVACGRSTTHYEEIVKVVRDTGINEAFFYDKYHNGEALKALDRDLEFAHSLGIRSLPSYLIQYRDKAILIKSLLGYDGFESAIREISQGNILPQQPEASEENIFRFIEKHRLVSFVELREAFDVEDVDKSALAALLEKGKIKAYHVRTGWQSPDKNYRDRNRKIFYFRE